MLDRPAILCPCCNRPMEAARAPIDALEAAPMEGNMRRIVQALVSAYPRRVSSAAMLDTLYGDRPDGGPETAERAVYVYVSRLRKRLPPYGWTVTSMKDGYGAAAGWRLEPVRKP